MTKLFDLSGRVALVTGASSGIGQAMAFALCRHGAKVVGIARRQQRLEEAINEVRRSGGEAASVVADLSDLSCLEAVASDAATKYGQIDILINAAGVNFREPAGHVSLERWRQTIDIHLGAPFFLAQPLVPAMQKQGWGRIINLASLQSQRAFPDSLPYGTAKGGVVQMTRAMAEAWSRWGINCNAIAPGFVSTELTAPVFTDKALVERHANQTAIGRNGVPSDLDGALIFLASTASEYITGQTLFVDGGYTAK